MTTAVTPYHKFEYAGAMFNVYFADKEEGLPFHQHPFNHAVTCQAGSCVIRLKGKEHIMYPKTQPVDLPANVPHEIEALENGTVFTNIFPAMYDGA
jgi:quercetin dioxygenase-like cupin family protein